MKKHKLIKNEYCDFKYTVTIGTDMGQFTGSAFCRVEDRTYQSDYFGWELAEIKAEIAYARAKRKYYEAQFKSLVQYWREMSNTRTYDPDAFWVKKMRQRVDEIDFTRQHWADRVENLKEAYHSKIITFDMFNTQRNRCKEYNND